MAKKQYLDNIGLDTLVDKIKSWVLGLGYTDNTGTITEVSTSTPLSGGGTSGTVSLSHDNSGVSAGSYGDSAAQTPAFGETFKVNYETVNATGHVTALSSHNVTIPNTVATASADGLMSASDKETLDVTADLASDNSDMLMTGIANGWLMDENGNAILSDNDTGIILEWNICHVTYEAGTGLSLDGNVFNHSNQVDAGTVGNDIEETLEIDGSFVIPYIAYDAQGHITKAGITTFIMSDVTESDIDSIFATASPSGYPDDDDDGKVAPGPEIVDPDNTDDGNSGNDNPDDDNDGDDNPDGNENGDDGDEMPAPDPGVVIPDDNDGSDDDDNDSDDSDSDDTDSGDNNDDSETNDNPDDLIGTLPDDPIE